MTNGKPKQTKAENAEFARKGREAEPRKPIKEAYKERQARSSKLQGKGSARKPL